MRRISIRHFAFECAVLAVLTLTYTAVCAMSEVTIMWGTVSPDGKIMTDGGEQYVISAHEFQEELPKNSEKKIVVTGRVEEEQGLKLIHITSYQWMGEDTGSGDSED